MAVNFPHQIKIVLKAVCTLYQFVIATPGRQDVWTVVLLLAVHHNLEDHPRVLQCVEHEAQGYSHLNHKHRKLTLVNRE